MKSIFFIFLFLFSCFSFAQNNHIVKIKEGRRVLLKADFTWEYIDALDKEDTSVLKKMSNNNCDVSSDFKEPNLNKKVQTQLKRGRATMKHVKIKVAKDYNGTVDKVQLLSVSETKQNGVYDFCVNGFKVKYKRVGYSIIKALF